MTERQRGDRTPQRALSVSVLVGTLLVPLSAVAALWMTDQARSDAAPLEGSGGAAIQVAVTSEPVAAPTGAANDDLATACGSAGLELVALENQGALSDIQQAALDSLRPICEQAQMPLPAPAASETLVQAPALSQAAAPTLATAGTFDDDDHDDDDHDDNDHDDNDDDADHDDDHDDDDRDDEDDD